MRDVTDGAPNIQTVLGDYCERLHAKRLDDIYEMDEFLATHNLTKTKPGKNKVYEQSSNNYDN